MQYLNHWLQMFDPRQRHSRRVPFRKGRWKPLLHAVPGWESSCAPTLRHREPTQSGRQCEAYDPLSGQISGQGFIPIRSHQAKWGAL